MAIFNLEKMIVYAFNPQHGERLLVMTDLPHGSIASNPRWEDRIKLVREWHAELERIAGRVDFILMPLMVYPATGQNNGPLPERCTVDGEDKDLREILASCDICLAITEFSATAPLSELSGKLGFRGATMPGLIREMMDTALACDYGEIARRCAILNPKLTDSVGADITFVKRQQLPGTQIMFESEFKLHVDLRNRTAHSGDGKCHKGEGAGKITNLPCGEVFIVPYEGEDDVLGVSRTEGLLPLYLDGRTVVCEVEGNRIVHAREEDGRTSATWERYFSKDKARANIAELGFGINRSAKIRGVVLEDEKAAFHIAYGRSEHLGGVTGPESFKSPENIIHQDVVFAKTGDIIIQNLYLIRSSGVKELIIKDSEYVF